MNRSQGQVERDRMEGGDGFAQPFGFDFSTQMSAQNYKALAEINGGIFAGVMSLNKEWSDFIAGRLSEDSKFLARLGKCTTPQSYFTAYSDFYRKAFADYQREFAAAYKIGETIVGNAADSLNKQIRDTSSQAH